ncbi:pilus assembly protein PilY [Acinetobacter lactucae]|nr:pilus assembly protein PilY [Acinetobacter lactucae]
MKLKLKNFKPNNLWYAICSSSVAFTWLMTSSVVQASDLQIYASPTAGKKTIVMMLDTSGSMGVNSSSNSINADYGVCSDRTTVQTDSGGSGSYTYSRTYCSVAYSTSTSSNYQRLKDKCYNPNKNADGSYSARTDSLKCYDRISRLKDGMFAFLDSNNPNLTNVRVGLGHYSVNGSGNAGKILVPAATLGATNSTQRNAIRTAVMGLTASGGTPTAAAYAEAAAYLMGTTTNAPVQIAVDVYRKEETRTISSYQCPNSYPYLRTNVAPPLCYERYESWRSQPYRGNSTEAIPVYGPIITTYYRCDSLNATDFSNEIQTCRSNGWVSLGGAAPSNLAQDGYYTNGNNTIYYKQEMQLGANSYSGFSSSISDSKKADLLSYASPLPAAADRVSCDGQGVYILSDGEPTNKTDSTLNSVMNASLSSTSFDCAASGALSSTNDWHCMSNYAKRLFNGGVIQSIAANAMNPVNVPIQTAFVGFGSDFTSLGSSDVVNACKLTSRTQTDRAGDDACSPNQGTNAIASPGYGNGGFFATQTPQGVTDSVIAFINNLGAAPLAPLTTGVISVPYDALNPKNLQEYGYLRAFEPNPANTYLTWRGNLKKYHVVLSGTNAGAFEANTGGLVYNASGAFRTGTKDYWNSSIYNDGGKVFLGGSYAKVPLPIAGQSEVVDGLGNITKYYYAVQSKIRNLFTDVSVVAADGSLTKLSTSGTNLLRIPAAPPEGTNPFDSVANTASYVLGKFDASTGQDILKDFPVSLKLKILNYLGYSTDINATTLPSSLVTSNEPYLSMGGSIHSLPVQLTYNGTLDENGNLTSAREQSILYGTMEGGLHIVDASTGVEQMAFVPADILNDPVASKALVVGQSDATAPAHGMDGAWVSDPAYSISTTGSGSSAVSKVTAKQMNIYGGMRMGGSSYYGLNVLNPASPKLLFRVGADQTNYSRMGQSWSKPVLANIRYNGVIKRVMIVGGGYDQCYENPNITLSNSCFTNGKAKGNAVYIIDAKTGERLWWTSDTGSNIDNSNMKHSIVSRISTLDRDADGLVDHLYFGDLGGQIFRIDLNNNQTKTNSTYSSFGIRVVRLANLATNDSTYDASNDYTAGNAPRFYEPPTVTIHDYGIRTFITVGIASGDRSTPLDVYPLTGREGMSPSTALSGRPVNNVYGIIDKDFIKKNLMSLTDSQLETKDITRSTLRKNPQILRSAETRVAQIFFPNTGTGQGGWYRSLSSMSDGTEKANNSFRIKGGLKAFEEPMAITGTLIVPVYDPQGTGIVAADPCLPRVVGETDQQTYCLPFGACLNSDGSIDQNKENGSGFRTRTGTNCPVGVSECNENVIGSGIRGVAFVPKIDQPPVPNSCGKLQLAGNENGTGEWQCTSHLVPVRWYERYR